MVLLTHMYMALLAHTYLLCLARHIHKCAMPQSNVRCNIFLDVVYTGLNIHVRVCMCVCVSLSLSLCVCVYVDSSTFFLSFLHLHHLYGFSGPLFSPLGIRSVWTFFLSFFLGWRIPFNHWTQRVVSTQLATLDPKNCPGPEDRSRFRSRPTLQVPWKCVK